MAMSKINKYPKLRFLFDRRKQSDKKTAGTIEIEVLLQGKRKYISTGVQVLPSQWKPDKEDPIQNNVDAINLNLKINNLKNSIYGYINSLIIENREFSWIGLDNFLKTKGEKGSFLDFIENTIKSRNDIRPNTRKNHNALLNSLHKANKIVTFSDLTLQNIEEYDKWLRDQDLRQTSIASRHKALKIYINEAIKKGRIEKNPYSLFKIEQGKPEIRKYLTDEELSKIEESVMPTESLERVKDLFIFQCYTGIAYVDLSKFDFKNVIQREGKYIIYDVRQKTGEEYYIVLLSRALEVLKKYDFILPLMSNQQYNMRLKIVADKAGISKELTSHMGRHTYATKCINAGIPIEALAKMMGHSDIKTTQIYAKMINKTVEGAFDVLESKLNTSRENNSSDTNNKPGADTPAIKDNGWNIELVYSSSF